MSRFLTNCSAHLLQGDGLYIALRTELALQRKQRLAGLHYVPQPVRVLAVRPQRRVAAGLHVVGARNHILGHSQPCASSRTRGSQRGTHTLHNQGSSATLKHSTSQSCQDFTSGLSARAQADLSCAAARRLCKCVAAHVQASVALLLSEYFDPIKAAVKRPRPLRGLWPTRKCSRWCSAQTPFGLVGVQANTSLDSVLGCVRASGHALANCFKQIRMQALDPNWKPCIGFSDALAKLHNPCP